EADEGGTLKANVTYSDAGNPANTESATSNISLVVADSADLVATLSTTTVTQGVDVSVAVTDAAATVTATTYQWQVSHDSGASWTNAAGTGAPCATHTPSEADEGGTLKANVTYSDAGNPANTESAT